MPFSLLPIICTIVTIPLGLLLHLPSMVLCYQALTLQHCPVVDAIQRGTSPSEPIQSIYNAQSKFTMKSLMGRTI